LDVFEVGTPTTEERQMANHLTPEEISKEFGIERKEVIRICVREHVPIYHGKIDKTLFNAVRSDSQSQLVASAG
jgi:hypothetical protein